MAREPAIALQTGMKLSFNSHSIKEATKILGLFDQPICLELLHTIRERQPATLIALCREHGGKKVLLARYLDQLVQASFIKVRNEGRRRLYWVNEARLQQVQSLVRTYFDPADGK